MINKTLLFVGGLVECFRRYIQALVDAAQIAGGQNYLVSSSTTTLVGQRIAKGDICAIIVGPEPKILSEGPEGLLHAIAKASLELAVAKNAKPTLENTAADEEPIVFFTVIPEGTDSKIYRCTVSVAAGKTTLTQSFVTQILNDERGAGRVPEHRQVPIYEAGKQIDLSTL
jgi:hypothetical protein